MRAALQQALDALEDCVPDSSELVGHYIASYGETYRPARLAAMRKTVSNGEAAITAIKQALAQPDEPVGYMVYFDAKLGGARVTDKLFVWRKEQAAEQIRAELIQRVEALYLHPAQPAKSLTLGQIDELMSAADQSWAGADVSIQWAEHFVRAIEAKIKERTQ